MDRRRVKRGIYNLDRQFGSTHSELSACDKFATDPPVIVDGDGKVYGRLTLNLNLVGAVKDHWVLNWLSELCQARPGR